jgi:hypothetical protein
MMKQVVEYFARLLGTLGQGWTRFWFSPSDPAILSAMRLLTGLVAVYLHATLALDLMALFGPNGLLPRADLSPIEAGNAFFVGNFSYLNYLTSPTELWLVHLIGLAILVLFAAGCWTRLTSVLGLVVFLSDVHHAPVITSGTELIVAMVMLYLCLAPCGRLFSVDRLLARRAQGATRLDHGTGELSTAATIATRLIQVHLVLLVAMMGFSKLSGEPWWTGLGMWWLIARPESRLVDFTWLHATPQVIDLWTHAIVAFELGFPLLIWMPIARPLLLAVAVVIWSSLALVTGDITQALMLCIASLVFVSPAAVRACCDRSVRLAAPEQSV